MLPRLHQSFVIKIFLYLFILFIGQVAHGIYPLIVLAGHFNIG